MGESDEEDDFAEFGAPPSSVTPSTVGGALDDDDDFSSFGVPAASTEALAAQDDEFRFPAAASIAAASAALADDDDDFSEFGVPACPPTCTSSSLDATGLEDDEEFAEFAVPAVPVALSSLAHAGSSHDDAEPPRPAALAAPSLDSADGEDDFSSFGAPSAVGAAQADGEADDELDSFSTSTSRCSAARLEAARRRPPLRRGAAATCSTRPWPPWVCRTCFPLSTRSSPPLLPKQPRRVPIKPSRSGWRGSLTCRTCSPMDWCPSVRAEPPCRGACGEGRAVLGVP